MEYSIRKFRREDTADLARCANYKEIADNLRDAFPHPYLFSDAAEFVRSAIESGNSDQIIRAICADDCVIGVISLTKGQDVHRHTAELGYFVTPAYRGRGIASEAVRSICSEFLDGSDICRIYASPFAWNHASHIVLEKAGFTREAVMKNAAKKNGTTTDVYIYALTKDPSDKQQKGRTNV